MSDFSALDPFENKQVLWLILIFIGIVLMVTVPFFGFTIIATAVIWLIYKNITRIDATEDRRFLGNQEEEIFSVLALAAYLSKADRKVSRDEYDYIKTALNESFPPQKANAYFNSFESLLRERISLKKVAQKINTNLTPNHKVQLLHFLIGLLTVDRILSPEEEQKLYAIARSIRIPKGSVRSLIALFQFQRTRGSNHNQKRAYQSKSTITSLSNAYAIFGVNPNASANEIKKKYRELAKKHHPDKVANLGPAFQKKAKEKFQLIQDAYELIKKDKGIK